MNLLPGMTYVDYRRIAQLIYTFVDHTRYPCLVVDIQLERGLNKTTNEAQNFHTAITNSLRVCPVSVSSEVVEPHPIGRSLSPGIVHIMESVTAVRGRVAELVRLPLQVEPDVAAQVADPVLGVIYVFNQPIEMSIDLSNDITVEF